MSIEELMYIEVTSPSKKEEFLFDTPASVYVITNEDIRRSGVRNIPDALRMAPGVHVARIDSNKWAITIRGFSNRFSNKLLVLMDGRIVYSPLFGGVFWEIQDTLLEDVERIEVIRGPGASLWGPNAVNGIINIITKHPKDTTGGYLEAGFGTEERGFVGGRYGGSVGDDLFYRVWGQFLNHDELADAEGDGAKDDWKTGRGGFRVDWDATSKDKVRLQGEIFRSENNERSITPILPPTFKGSFSGGYIMTNWNHKFEKNGETDLVAYYDLVMRDNIFNEETRHIFDVEFKHRIDLFSKHDFIWGFDIQFTSDNIDNEELINTTDNESRTDHYISGFLQDEITLSPGRLYLTLGTKFEHNTFSGYEVQPTARLLFKPNEKHRAWAAVSRAVRIQTRLEDTFSISIGGRPDPVTGEFVLRRSVPNDDLEPEELLAFEIGYRTSPVSWFSIDITGFLNFYDNLSTFEPGEPFVEETGGPPITVIPLMRDNKANGEVFGIEIATNFQPVDFWKLSVNYSWIELRLHQDRSSNDPFPDLFEDRSPRHQVHLRSFLELPGKIDFDTMLYFQSEIEGFDTSAHVRLDLRLAWNPLDNVEVSVVGQNLLETNHYEFAPRSSFVASQVQRSVYGMVRWHF